MRKKILITGGSGFIGFHLCKRLIEDGFAESVMLAHLSVPAIDKKYPSSLSVSPCPGKCFIEV